MAPRPTTESTGAFAFHRVRHVQEFELAFASIRGEFRGRTWEAVAEWYDELLRGHEGFESHQYMRDIVAQTRP